MPWVRFLRPYDYRHTIHRLTAYRGGREYRVTSKAAEKAIADGAAVLTEKEKARRRAAESDDGDKGR